MMEASIVKLGLPSAIKTQFGSWRIAQTHEKYVYLSPWREVDGEMQMICKLFWFVLFAPGQGQSTESRNECWLLMMILLNL